MSDKNDNAIGPIRFLVFTGSDGKPWVCRMKLIYVSPQGKSFHFQAMDTESPYLHKCKEHDWPSETIEDAIRTYQRHQLGWYMGRDISPQVQIQRILDAESLLKEKPDWEPPTAAPAQPDEEAEP